MLNIKKTLILAILAISIKASAQTDSPSVTIYKDPRVNMLVKKQAQINEETTRNNRRTMPGFRLQVLNTTDRKNAIEAKTKIYQLYPELRVYLQYQSPYYRLKAGNFKTRQEAEEYQQSLSREFQNSVFIVRDVIEVKPEAEIINNN